MSAGDQQLGRHGFTWVRGETDDEVELGPVTGIHYLTDSEAGEVVENVMNLVSGCPTGFFATPKPLHRIRHPNRCLLSAVVEADSLYPGEVGPGADGWRLEHIRHQRPVIADDDES